MRVRYLVPVIVWLVAAAALASPAVAMEPPARGELARYASDGTLDSREARADALGNSRLDEGFVAAARARTSAAQGASTLPAPPPGAYAALPSVGSPRVLALCIDFSDYPAYNSTATILARLNGAQNPGDTTYPYESLRAYYQRSSYGKLDVQADVLGWYRPAAPRSAMTTTTAGRENLIKQALQYYDARGVDLSRYDNDGNGQIDYLMVFWSGPDDGWGNFWWGYYTGWWQTPAVNIDGVGVDMYSWQWESRKNSSGQWTAFSPRTVIHETGHSLGLPDYYDYDVNTGPDGGLGYYDMMDASIGDHNAFSKWLLGWVTPTAVTTYSPTAKLRPSGTYPDALVVMPDANASNPFSEYFIVQNRQKAGNDDESMMRYYGWYGIAVWHVDARLDSSGWDFLSDNSRTAHKLLALEQADGLGQIEASDNGIVDSGDFWKAGQSFDAVSVPSSARYDGGASSVKLDGFVPGTEATVRALIEGAGDTIAPVTTATVDAAWHNTAVTVPLQGFDAGTGVASTWYSVDYGPWTQGVSAQVAAPADGSGDGTHSVRFYSIDGAGNTEAARQVSVRIDTTAPVTKPGALSADGSTVVIPLSATDAHSGVASTSWRVDAGAWTSGTVASASADTTHVVQYRSVDRAGNLESAGSVTVGGAAQAVSIALPATLVTPYSAGSLAGTITAGGVPVSGAKVSLERSGDAVTWTVANSGVIADAAGRFSFPLSATSKTLYRVRYAPGALADIVGTTVTVMPKALLSTPSAPTAISRTKAFIATGTLKPRHAVGTYPVKIQCFRYEGGTWVLRKTVLAKASGTGSYSTYSGKVWLPYAGRWKIRALHADTGHAATYTATRALTVR